MKRIIALVLGIIMVLGCVPAMAQGDAKAMEAALIAVKGKVEIPAELSEFDSSSYKMDNRITYNFSWYDKDRTASIDINCDELGRISSYHYYSDDMYKTHESNQLATVTRDEVAHYANNFVAKLLPETTMGEGDVLFCDAEKITASVSESGTRYYIPYKRTKEGVYVDGNVANVSILATGDDMVVSSVSCSYDYETQFKVETELADFDYIQAYEGKFPGELVYAKHYDDKGEPYTKLVYQFKDMEAGYISAALGEVVERDKDSGNRVYSSGGVEEDSTNTKFESMLTPEEMGELDAVAGLKKVEDVEKTIRSITALKLEKDMKLQESNIRKSDDNYLMTLRFYKEDAAYSKACSVTVDAKTGKIKSISNYGDYNADSKEPTDAQKKKTEQAMDNFVAKYAGDDYKICTGDEAKYTQMTASKTYVRHENGVPVMDENINISYNIKNDKVESFRNYLDHTLTFEPTDGVLGDGAYKQLLKAAPIGQIYIKSGGEYVLCYSVCEGRFIQIDAKTGAKFDPYSQEDNKAEYNDIADHWCKDAVQKLGEVGIALPGESFNPESAITQEDLLRIFASGFNYNWFMTVPVDDLYREMYTLGILTKEERNEAATVKREDAFVYMIRFAQLERVAKLSKIFTVEFKDGSAITPEKLGYVAILSGMGIVGGDNAGVRPQDSLTRAEAAVMLYKYLTIN